MIGNSQGDVCQNIDLIPTCIGIKNFIEDFEEFSDLHLNDKVAEAKQSFEEIFQTVASMRHEVNAENSKTSFLFNFFDIFHVYENKMSEILAFLLNPKGKHGQGDLYFKEFCKYFALQIPHDNNSFYISCEEPTNINRRIDLLIKTGDHFIIIENKFRGAEDQKHQLEHYYEFIRRKADSENHVYLFYVKDGSEPSDYSLPKNGDVWKELSTSKNIRSVAFKKHAEHKSIFIFLEKCKQITASENEKMRFFIDDIMHHISRENKMNKYGEQIFDWLYEKSERTEYAFEVYRRWNDYRKFIIDKFFATFTQNLNHALSNKFEGRQFKIEKYGDFITKNHSGYRFCVFNDYHVYLQSDSMGFDNIHYGFGPFHDKDKNVLNQKDIELKLHAEILANFNASGFKTPFSIVKYQSKESKFGGIDNLIKLLPEYNNAIMETWINELIDLMDFIIKSAAFKELCQTQLQLIDAEPLANGEPLL